MMQKEYLKKVDFDYWTTLANQDPDAFEELRLAVIDELISEAPKQLQQRLRCLQWRIDQERDRAQNPLAACIRISNMMWEKVLGKNGFLESLQSVTDSPSLVTEPQPHEASAAVIPFSCRPRSN